MKNYLDYINKAFESKARLGIMSVLMVQEKVEFSKLKETLHLTDGNLASHLRALEEATYLRVDKQFLDRKPNTTYALTQNGKHAFQLHLDALENLIVNHKPNP
ncbi:winged helix-turn-helix domain-containing protein [Rufibacter latericius]|uniref:Transcriptional regulator n=1 Tax=Rufibacter latericius TaxID=2487040 RepID=A0A3M9MBP4_9BACT|nr:transcriptional regulator [Rufibacter latericius]RNI22567.1 transcriptional regulator [Rufibacter latericius]